MRTFKTPLLLIAALLLLALFLFPGCQSLDSQSQNNSLSATILLDFSDPNVLHDGTGGYLYFHEGQSYPATHKAWLTFNCPLAPRFFAAYNNVDQTIWLAHCVEGVFLSTLDISINGNSYPAPFLNEVNGGQEETFEFQTPAAALFHIEDGITQMTMTFAYQND